MRIAHVIWDETPTFPHEGVLVSMEEWQDDEWEAHLKTIEEGYEEYVCTCLEVFVDYSHISEWLSIMYPMTVFLKTEGVVKL